MNSLIGQTLNRIHIEEIIAIGTFGWIYLGDQKGKKVALKYIPHYSNHQQLSTEQDQIQHEIKINRILNKQPHPNVLPFLDSFKTHDGTFLVFEWMPNGDLFEWMKSKKSEFIWMVQSGSTEDFEDSYLEYFESVKDIFTRVLQGLQHCHQLGVYHRDIKPENILLDTDNNPKWADFGLATQELISSEFDIGTLSFMSPEVLNEDNQFQHYQSNLADVWALGVLLANMLLLDTPFSSPSKKSNRYKNLVNQMPSLMTQKRGVHASITELLQQCWSLEDKRISLDLFIEKWILIVNNNEPLRTQEAFYQDCLEWSQQDDCSDGQIYTPQPSLFASQSDSKAKEKSWMKFLNSEWANLDQEEEMDYNEPILFESESPKTSEYSFLSTSNTSKRTEQHEQILSPLFEEAHLSQPNQTHSPQIMKTAHQYDNEVNGKSCSQTWSPFDFVQLFKSPLKRFGSLYDIHVLVEDGPGNQNECLSERRKTWAYLPIS